MPDNKKYLSKLTLKDGTVVEIKDAVARRAIVGGMHYIGTTETALEDLSGIRTIYINGVEYSAANGDIVLYGTKEFIFSDTDGRWHEMGDLGSLGSLASKDTASGYFTPEGSVSKPDIAVTETETTVKELDQDGTVTDGSQASCTFPQLQFSYDSNSSALTVSLSGGSFTPNTPTQVTLPTYKDTSVLSGVSAELEEAPTFTGTQGSVVVE